MAKPKKDSKAKKTPRQPKRSAVSKAKKIGKNAIPKKELKSYKELLLKERDKIGGEISHIAKDALSRSQRDASGDLSGYSYHMADVASDNYEMEFSLGRATDEQKFLYAIDEALRRIADKTYGLCVQCGKKIARKRLRALPYTALCIDCQKESEGK